MVSQVSAGSSAVQGVRHLHRIHRDAEWASRPAPETGDSATTARDGVQIGSGPVQARQSLDNLRQALTSGDAGALRGAVHAFRVHDEAGEAQPTSVAVSGPAAAPAEGASPGWRVHRGYEAGGHDDGRRALMATLGSALVSGDLEAARKAYADLTAGRGQQAQAPAATTPVAEAQAPATTAAVEPAPVESAAPAAGEVPVPAAEVPTSPAARTELAPADAPATDPAPASASQPASAPVAAPTPSSVPLPDITAIPPAPTTDQPATADAASAVTAAAAAPTATESAGKPSRQDAMAALGTALAAGDIDAARKAFADLAAQGARGHHGHHHHHHHHDGGDSGAQMAAGTVAPTSPAGETPATDAPATDAAAADTGPAPTAVAAANPDATPADEAAPA